MYPALVSLLLGSFAIGTTEFVVTGLLPAIAADLGISIPDAGFLVTGYALSVAVLGPALALVAARFPRKPALLAVVVLFILGHVVSALAPSFATLMVGRAVAAAAHGCYFGLAILLATSIAPPGKRGMALAIVVGGINVANILGVPLGTAVGTAWGWRAAFVMVGLIGVAAFVAIAVFAPGTPRSEHVQSSLAAQVRALRVPKVVTSYLLIVLHMIAFWSLSTFIAPYFIETGGVSEGTLPVILLAFGVFGGLGIVAGGRYADRYPVGSLTVSYPLIAVCFLVTWIGTAWWWPIGVLGIGLVWTIGSLAVIGVQNRVLLGAAAAPELASSLISAIFNVGIAAGAALGSQALAGGMPVSELPLVSVAFAAAAGLLAVAATRGEASGRR
jgi:DHA1 family inner membrane transport protein